MKLWLPNLQKTVKLELTLALDYFLGQVVVIMVYV